jgi:hypothetical protein
MIDTVELCDALDNAGFNYRAYSGRAMFGAECVGVDLEDDSDLWRLAKQLGLAGIDTPAPRTDSMGCGLIAYWPSAKWASEDA